MKLILKVNIMKINLLKNNNIYEEYKKIRSNFFQKWWKLATEL